MACLKPLTGYYSAKVNPTGRRSIVFKKELALSPTPLEVPCQQCVECRLSYARAWAIRLMHERKMHQDAWFLTLTYREKDLPPLRSLVKRDLQLFMKRLRKIKGSGVRFFACGEYGETTLRPHYHVILFGTHFLDMKFWKMSGTNRLYVSAELDSIWTSGHCTIGGVDFQSCAYVAGYVIKKIRGEMASAHYAGRIPEFSLMSRRPGIGFGYYEKFGKEAYKHDSVVMDGHEVAIPRYYDKKYEIVDLDDLERIKRERRRKARLALARDDQSSRRKRAKELFLLRRRAYFAKGEV